MTPKWTPKTIKISKNWIHWIIVFDKFFIVIFRWESNLKKNRFMLKSVTIWYQIIFK